MTMVVMFFYFGEEACWCRMYNIKHFALTGFFINLNFDKVYYFHFGLCRCVKYGNI